MIQTRNIIGGMANLMFKEAYIYAQMRKGLIPDIYVQDESYFKEYADEIRARFGMGIVPINKVSIAVRRGDYVNNPFYVDLMTTEYYERAMALFPNEKFIVISDDIEWCKQQKIFKDCEFSEGRTDVEDLNLMAGCKGHIIANSSYSWWAAWLSGNRTIAPKAWHPDGVERTKLPEKWERI